MMTEPLAQSPWLLLVVQSTACLAAGLAGSYALRHRPARAHQVLLMALLTSVLMPGLYRSARHFGLGVLTPRTPPLSREAPDAQSEDPGAFVHLPATESAYEPATAPMPESAAEVPAYCTAISRVPWDILAIAGWITATLTLLIRLILRFLLGVHVVRTARPLENDRLHHAVAAAKSRLTIGGSVRVRCSERVQSPVVWCWGRAPILLVHQAAVDRHGKADWVGVFCHELAHWRRRDHLTGLLAETLTAAFPWHPLLWWTKSRLLRLSEQACDDWVLAGGQTGVDYAESLLTLLPERQAAFVPTVVGKEKAMKERIRRIVKDRSSNPRVGVRWGLAVTVVAILASVSVALAQRRPAPQPGESEEQVVIERQERPESIDPAPALRRRALERMLDQLSGQIRDREAALREQGDRPSEERQVLEFELGLLREQAQQIEGRLRRPEEPRPGWIFREGKWVPARPGEVEEREVIVRRPPAPEINAKLYDALRQQREELAEKIRAAERELEGLRDDQDQEARELRTHLARLRELMGALEERLARSRAQVERVRIEQTPRETEERARAEHQRRLRAELADLERELQKRREQGQEDGPESREVRERLRVLSEELRAVEGRRAPQERPPVVRGERRTPEEGEGRTEVRVFKLREPGTAAHARDAIRPVLGRSGQVSVDERTNSLIVSTTPENMARVEAILRELDVPPGRRNLEAEVEELRNQMRELREQVQQMHRLMEEVAAQSRARESAGERR